MGFLLLKSLLFGILEGVTEWLPVSSTGHLILLESFLTLDVGADLHPQFPAEFNELFLVAIQLGAVLAVITKYQDRLIAPLFDRVGRGAAVSLWGRVIVGCFPAGIVGILADYVLERLTGKDMDSWLFHGFVVACMLILYGVLFVITERMQKGKEARVTEAGQLTLGQALGIGLFQTLSLVPGTSRSGATILGGMLLGLSRTAAAEFSFFMAVPVMVGACGIKTLGFARFMLQNGLHMPYQGAMVLLVAGVVAYVTSRLTIRFLIDFTSRHGFAVFGIYRIVLGAAVLLYVFI